MFDIAFLLSMGCLRTGMNQLLDVPWFENVEKATAETSQGGSDKCGGIPIGSLLMMAARARPNGDPMPATKAHLAQVEIERAAWVSVEEDRLR
jgi:hypothetical protein